MYFFQYVLVALVPPFIMYLILFQIFKKKKEIESIPQIDNNLVDILKDFFKDFKNNRPGPSYISDAHFIYRKALAGETDRAGAILWLEDMCRRMESEYYPRDTKLVRECIEEIKKVGA